ncbi:DUF5672 family protein [Mucilaginibacter sp.]|jgi:hypothetical protein|uniref:DUF5672 family protein n=1 Tax=Mucilaginibacter sp. TaxID=1882438 RepID=UPI003569A98E
MALTNDLCVIIPVHKPVPSADEIISLSAANVQLNAYDCFLVYPDGMDTSLYTSLYPELKLKLVNPEWLSSIEQYNKMKLRLDFYNLFSKYQYMLTYELDAYIFHSDFEGTGALNFDFIGAPFFEGYWDTKPGAPLAKGCNSGFSIRNVRSCIRVLSSMNKFRFGWWIYKIFLSHSSKLRIKLNELTNNKYEIYISGKFGFYFADFHLNEDLVWSEIVPQLFPEFKVADPMSALKFSFEYNLKDSLRLNGDKLPLGCHAWYKHLNFWKHYINIQDLT